MNRRSIFIEEERETDRTQAKRQLWLYLTLSLVAPLHSPSAFPLKPDYLSWSMNCPLIWIPFNSIVLRSKRTSAAMGDPKSIMFGSFLSDAIASHQPSAAQVRGGSTSK